MGSQLGLPPSLWMISSKSPRANWRVINSQGYSLSSDFTPTVQIGNPVIYGTFLLRYTSTLEFRVPEAKLTIVIIPTEPLLEIWEQSWFIQSFLLSLPPTLYNSSTLFNSFFVSNLSPFCPYSYSFNSGSHRFSSGLQQPLNWHPCP